VIILGKIILGLLILDLLILALLGYLEERYEAVTQTLYIVFIGVVPLSVFAVFCYFVGDLFVGWTK
jgi:hypothetical protein